MFLIIYLPIFIDIFISKMLLLQLNYVFSYYQLHNGMRSYKKLKYEAHDPISTR